MKLNKHCLWLAFFVLGCDNSNPKEQVKAPQSTSTQTLPSTSAQDDSITISHVRYYDLTGDGAAERISVKARGNRYDSLRVVLEIRSPKDSLLFRDIWNSVLYFVYDTKEGKSSKEIEKIVRNRIDSVLSDRAFEKRHVVGPKGKLTDVDTGRISYDIAENIWRKNNGISVLDSLPIRALNEIQQIKVPADRLSRISSEVIGKPVFTYFSGGERTATISWSPSEGRFIIVWECC